MALCIVVGVPIAWILARTRAPGRDTLDGLNTLILAIPGTAIGIAYIRAFHVDLPGLERGLTSLWIILPLVLAVRRLPYTVRGAYASLLLVHRSMEEAAASVGATGLSSFRDVTLPLIWRGVLVGSLFSFMTSLQEASAVLFLSLGRLGDDHGRDLLLLHRGQRQRGRRPRRHPDRRGERQRAGDQPRRRRSHGWDVRVAGRWKGPICVVGSGGAPCGVPEYASVAPSSPPSIWTLLIALRRCGCS